MRALLLALLLAGPVAAPLAADPLPADLVRLDVLPGWRAADGRHVAGLRLTLAEGWKTYWRAPGSAGLAPVLDFAGSRGVDAVQAQWPVPHAFRLGGLRSIGYEGAVTIPLDLRVGPGPARLVGRAAIGVCRDVCVPVTLTFAADLPDSGPDGGGRDPLIVAALVDRPMTAEEAGARATCAVAPDANGLALTVRLDMAPLGPDEDVVIESADPSLWIGEPADAREGATLVATAPAVARDGGPPVLDRSALRITVLGGGRAVDIRGCEAG